ncbi:tRNA-dihydrouridine synthase [Demequina capsici]|uniref:tRNA-dihydrouridine synthase n=1 Tax=Demequina capsici TaxID=3075620 RepID=A0AA96JBL7_9MICO|nr:tRNA-dihydrouridine synthase [Demequina sp. OYTSA14]WNM25861.1 tRNA-dihydrouridine synthase [Demequina sp. OYTSA14]
MHAFYDPMRTYEDNLAHGPFAVPVASTQVPAPSCSLWGVPVAAPFGIPAGPLVGAAACEAAFGAGFDVNVYKTVRTRAHAAHAFPNTLAVHVEGDLAPHTPMPLLADQEWRSARSISNSFGVPSSEPDVWQPDMARAVAAAAPGQMLVGSFQGTVGSGDGSVDAYVADHVLAARLVAQTGVPAMEMNLSCPNEGTGRLLCFDPDLVGRIARAVKEQVPDVPLVLKLAYFADQAALERLVVATDTVVDGYAAINTLPARLVDPAGRQALPGAGRQVAGVCGAAIRWAGLEMISRLAALRARRSSRVLLVGVGGVLSVADHLAYRAAGADAVMAATGAMMDPGLGRAVRAASAA